MLFDETNNSVSKLLAGYVRTYNNHVFLMPGPSKMPGPVPGFSYTTAGDVDKLSVRPKSVKFLKFIRRGSTKGL